MGGTLSDSLYPRQGTLFLWKWLCDAACTRCKAWRDLSDLKSWGWAGVQHPLEVILEIPVLGTDGSYQVKGPMDKILWETLEFSRSL